MFHHYIFIRRLAQQLHDELKKASLVTCFSQQKDELILGFIKPDQTEFYIKASLEPQVNLLSFPVGFQRAKRNSVELFTEILGEKVETVFAYNCDRSFALHFESGAHLIFKLHGRRSNIVLVDRENKVSIFKNNLPADLAITKDNLERDFTIATINEGQLKQAEQVMGEEAISWLDENENYHTCDFEAKKKLLLGLELQWFTGEIYLHNSQPPVLSFIKNDVTATFANPVFATNAYYSELIFSWHLTQTKNQLIQKLQAQVKQTQSYLSKTKSKYQEIKHRRSFEEIGHLIMANLHHIPAGSAHFTVDDLYQGGQLAIKLKSEISPQKMAEVYYRKAKNEKLEIETLARNIEKKEQMLMSLQSQILKVENTESVKQLKSDFGKIVKDESTATERVVLPFHEFEFSGYQIWVGKNAQNNDKLTFASAKKEDFWLHARDVSGSHVVVRNPGKLLSLPNDVLTVAAQLAAYHSKRKTDTLCPVAYTQRKYIRKPKNAPAGKVIMEREAVIMVKPLLPLKRIND